MEVKWTSNAEVKWTTTRSFTRLYMQFNSVTEHHRRLQLAWTSHQADPMDEHLRERPCVQQRPSSSHGDGLLVQSFGAHAPGPGAPSSASVAANAACTRLRPRSARYASATSRSMASSWSWE